MEMDITKLSAPLSVSICPTPSWTGTWTPSAFSPDRKHSARHVAVLVNRLYSESLRGWLCQNVYGWFPWTARPFVHIRTHFNRYLLTSSGESPVLGWLRSPPTRVVPLLRWRWSISRATCLFGLGLSVPHSPATYTFLVTRVPGAGVGRDLGGWRGPWFTVSLGAQDTLRTWWKSRKTHMYIYSPFIPKYILSPHNAPQPVPDAEIQQRTKLSIPEITPWVEEWEG